MSAKEMFGFICIVDIWFKGSERAGNWSFSLKHYYSMFV